MNAASTPMKIVILGLSITSSWGNGHATTYRGLVRELVRRGHDVVCFVRHRSGIGGSVTPAAMVTLFDGAKVKVVDPTDPISLSRDGFAGEAFDAVVSCMASRTGVPRDAWAIDHRAHVNLLHAAQQAGIGHFVQLSAICVQKPLLAFQQAKLAFEAALIGSGLRYSIVRPTAFFKSLSG
jgi:divinyl chlorophyllide a 8-vinyl-reductase